jgi:PIN domain nuclease of toxin-antitoxin system
VTPWEIAILNSEAIGKQRRIELPSRRVSEIMEAMGARLLPMSLIHTAAIHTLPLHHHDPFDRMIIAQALEERCPVVSSDERFEAYKSAGLQLIWG